MPPHFFDSSVCIQFLRSGEFGRLFPAPAEVRWLSAVVLCELRAGARRGEVAALDQLASDYAGIGRLFCPSLDDWRECGIVLARFAERFGYETIGRSRITNDALIAIGAAKHSLTLLTANRKDFARLNEFIPFQWELV